MPFELSNKPVLEDDRDWFHFRASDKIGFSTKERVDAAVRDIRFMFDKELDSLDSRGTNYLLLAAI